MHNRNDVRCDTCFFYERFDDQPDRGQCRFHAPFPVGALLAPWPIVSGAHDWCGRWRRDPHLPGEAVTVELIPGTPSPA